MNTISFPKIFNINNGKTSTTLSYNYKSIHESLTSLFLTNPGELLGDPAYGCGLRNKLFDIKSDTNMTELRNIIIKAIDLYMPEIKVSPDNIKIYSDSNNNKYKIVVMYALKNTATLNTYELVL